MNRVGAARPRRERLARLVPLSPRSTRFAPLCRARGRARARRAAGARAAGELRRAVEAHGWDGAGTARGYYDDGSPLGSAQRDECRIDSIAQSWAVLSGAGEPRARRAWRWRPLRRELVRAATG